MAGLHRRTAALAIVLSGSVLTDCSTRAPPLADEQLVVVGAPPAEFHDWLVVGACGYPGSLPSIEVAAVPPHSAVALEDAGPWDLACDGPDADAP